MMRKFVPRVFYQFNILDGLPSTKCKYSITQDLKVSLLTNFCHKKELLSLQKWHKPVT